MLDPHVVRTPLTRLARLCTIAVGLAFTASVASFAAQSPFATLTGTVHDQLGGTVPKVTLTLTHAESGAKHEITSNGMGRYEFVGLPSGTYTLAAYAAGFSPVQRGLQIAAGQTHTEDVTIDVGTLHETLTVHEGPGTSAPLMPRKAGPVPAAGCTSQPNSGGIKPPLKVHDSKPVYPAAMRGSGLDGRVELEATIGIDGTVLTMRTIGATNPDFEEAARQAVGEWRFTTTLLNCVPVEVKMDVLVAFTP